jgi:hypothetical protein
LQKNKILIKVFYFVVSCCIESNTTTWKLKQYNNSTDISIYIKSQDRITLQNDFNKVLRSHELEFDLNNEKFQEVFGHDESVGENDEVCCNIINITNNEE